MVFVKTISLIKAEDKNLTERHRIFKTAQALCSKNCISSFFPYEYLHIMNGL